MPFDAREFMKGMRALERIAINPFKNLPSLPGLTMARRHILMEIGELGRTTTKQLAGNLNLNKSTISRTVESLVKAWLVKRAPHPSDRRFTVLTLTDRGKMLFENFNRFYEDRYKQVMQKIPEKDRAGVFQYGTILLSAMTGAKEKEP